MTNKQKNSNNETKFRPGATGVCEAELWAFSGSTMNGGDTPVVHWVAGPLAEAVHYLKERHPDFAILKARYLGMAALLAASPLD